MKVTAAVDPDRGTLHVQLDMSLNVDPDIAADVAWAAVEKAVTWAQRDRGSDPAGLTAIAG